MEAECGHGFLPLFPSHLERKRLTVNVVEAGAYARTLSGARDACLADDRVLFFPHARGQRPPHEPDLSAQERGINFLPDARHLRAVKSGQYAAKSEYGARLIGNRNDAGL